MIWGFEYARGEPIPWPKDVPAPPANVVPEEYAPNSPKSYDHVMSARFRPQIEKLLRAMNSSNPPRAMLLNGHKWTVVPRADRRRARDTQSSDRRKSRRPGRTGR